MRFATFITSAVLLGFALAHEGHHDAATPEESDVLSLTQATFTNSVDPEALILVEFYAPWYV